MTEPKKPNKPGRRPGWTKGTPPVGKEPVRDVVARHKEAVINAGGARLDVMVGPEANQALNLIIQSQGNEPTQKGAKKAAVEAALIQTAKLLER